MSFDSLLLLILDGYFDSSDLLCWVGEDEYIPHRADCTQTFRIWASLKYLEHSEIRKIEDKYLCFQYDDASLGVYPDCLHL